MYSFAEENYLKAIYKYSVHSTKGVSTSQIAKEMDTKASSVTDMLKKLSEKKLLVYKKYQGVTLTPEGLKVALWIVRKHRLWEVFLVEKLKFKWDEVHEIAEQLEHIQSKELIERLDEHLDFPRFDPHGDPIPDADGNLPQHFNNTLSELQKGDKAIVMGVKEHDPSFLQYLDSAGIALGTPIQVEEILSFDNSFRVILNDSELAMLSLQVSKNLIVSKKD